MTSARKAWFLDRDGTIIEDRHYLHDPDQIVFLPNSIEAMRRAYKDRFLLIIVTNQSGIGRGYFTEEAADAVDQRFRETLAGQGVFLTDILRCPHYPGGISPYNRICSCRKPETGLFREAIERYELDPSLCLACGDKLRDIQKLPELGIPAVQTGLIGQKPGEYRDLLVFYKEMTARQLA